MKQQHPWPSCSLIYFFQVDEYLYAISIDYKEFINFEKISKTYNEV